LECAKAITVEELGTGPAEIVELNCTGVGSVWVEAGILNLNVDGVINNVAFRVGFR